MNKFLMVMAEVHPGWFAFGVVLFTAGLVTLVWQTIGRKGNVTMGPDPVIPTISDATTVILPRQPILPNYKRSEEYRSELADWFPMADTVDLTPQLAAVAAFFERTTTVTVERGVVITIPEPRPRHRWEDVHSETQPLDASLRRAIAAGRPE